MAKSLIINADDFGFDDESSAGILDLLEQRKISSTTVMTNFVKEVDLKSLLKIPDIGVGLHLNLIEGKPICPPDKIPDLVDGNGEFLGPKNLMTQAFLHRIPIQQIYLETEAQLNLLVSKGIQVTHADSHQHIHQFPVLGDMIQSVLHSLKVKKIRNSYPLATSFGLRPLILKLFTRLAPISNKDFLFPQGLISNLSFGKELNAENFSKAILTSFHNHSCLEMMTHPATKDKKGSYLNRKIEYEFWKEQPILELLKMNQIELIHFGNL